MSSTPPGNLPDGSFPIPMSRSNFDITSAGGGGAASFLTSSAPVSSLLPPLPTTNAQQQQHFSSLMGSASGAASMQAQLAALLTQGAAAAALGVNPAAMAAQQQLPVLSNAAAASHLLAAATSASAAAPVMTNPLLTTNVNMHGWSVDQIENHIKLLRQLKQHVPQNVTMLLHEAKKRAEKRHAKRIANRKSACSSRARKKALVQEMTALNTRLRRQALILSLLPDLVIVVDVEGTITFCSAQVERVLQHSIDDLIGARLVDIVAPTSRTKVMNFMQDLLSPPLCKLPTDLDGGERPSKGTEQDPRRSSRMATNGNKKKPKTKKGLDDNEDEGLLTSGESANAVTDSSFPLSVVQVEQTDGAPNSSDDNDNSDESNSKQPSSLTTNSIAGNSGSDGGAGGGKDGGGRATSKKTSGKDHPSSDSSNISSNTESSDAKNLLSANANLERNVRWHNKKIMKDKHDEYKDDVLGAAVTANNASARLSSLRHRTSDSEEDSGYRESNDSREETSSSEGEASSEGNGRRKPIAPTCNVCLIRDDLTTVWCEVTSSVRTKDVEDELDDGGSVSNADGKVVKKMPPTSTVEMMSSSSRKRCRSEEGSFQDSEDVGGLDDMVDVKRSKEILLCLRPIRDGDEKTDEAYRFKPARKKDETASTPRRVMVSEENSGEDCTDHSNPIENGHASNDLADGAPGTTAQKQPSASSTPKKNRMEDDGIDHAVVESLMSMSSQKKKDKRK